MRSVYEIFETICDQHADKIALTGDSITWTYSELAALVACIAGGLEHAGVGAGDFVAVFVERSPWFVAAVLAILRRGAVYVPIDPEYPLERQRSIIDDIGAKIGIVSRDADRSASNLVRELIVEELAGGAPDSGPVARSSDDAVYVMFTSGSTGKPKGSIIPSRGIVRLVCDADYAEFGPEETWALMSSISFDASTLEIWGALLNGGRCAVLEDRLPSIDRIEEFFKKHKVTSSFITSALFNTVVDYRASLFRDLRVVLTGGEIESSAQFRKFLEACPKTRLVHCYGPTENTTFSLCHTVAPSEVVDAGGRVPIGKPIRGTDAVIVNEQQAAVADGDPGELLLGGLGVSLGYLGQPELTREKFITLEGRDGTWYRTGDLVRTLPNGDMLFVGRLDRQIKLRGFRIEPEEIEKAALACPGVVATALMVEGDHAENRRLHLYCAVPPTETSPSGRDLRRWLQSRLPAPMVPAELTLLPDLPRGSTGKVDRSALPLTRPHPGADIDEGDGVEGELSATEQLVADLWRELLPGRAIRRNTDFFSIGGHSIQVLKFVAELQKRRGVRLPPSAVYAARTLRNVALAADSAPKAPWTPSGTRAMQKAGEPSACGHTHESLHYEWTLNPGASTYHVIVPLAVEKGLDPDLFERRFREIVAAHDSLRATVNVTDRGTEQRFDQSAPPTVDRSVCPEWNEHQPLPPAVLERIRAPFDLRTGPVVRAHLFDRRGSGWLVVLVLHHSVIDEWSVDLLLDQLAAPPNAPVTAMQPSVREFVEWERGNVNSAEARARGEQLGRDAAEGYPLLLRGRGAACEFVSTLSPETVGGVMALAQQEKTTPFVVMLSAAALLIARHYGLAAPWIATPFANRSDPSLRDIIGCLIDVRPIRVDTRRASTFRALVREVHQIALREQDSGPIPLVEVLQGFHRAGGHSADLALQFAMSYRVAPQRQRTVLGIRARPVRAPVDSAKFGLMLQFEQNEGRLDCVAEGDSAAWPGDSLSGLLKQLSTSLPMWLAAPDAEVASVAQPSGTVTIPPAASSRVTASFPDPREPGAEALQLCCRDVWCAVLERNQVRDEDDFYECGGSSILAVRLAASLRQLTGRELNLAEFVEEPNFANLKHLTHSGGRSSIFAGLGDPSSDFVLVGIPGLSGYSISYYSLGVELRKLLARPVWVMSLDFVELTEPLLHGASFESVTETIATIVRREVGDRRFAMMGYSLGGSLALGAAERLVETGAGPEHLWLLDSYDASLVWPTRKTKILNAIERLGRDPLHLPRWVRNRLVDRSRTEPVSTEPGNGNGSGNGPESDKTTPIELTSARDALREPFSNAESRPFSGPATLIRSSHVPSQYHTLASGKFNGMDRLLAGPRRAETVDVEHLEFLRGGAGVVAGAIARELTPLLERTTGATSARSSRQGGGA